MYHIGAGAASAGRGSRHANTDIATTNCRAENMTACGKLRTFSLYLYLQSSRCSCPQQPVYPPPTLHSRGRGVIYWFHLRHPVQFEDASGGVMGVIVSTVRITRLLASSCIPLSSPPEMSQSNKFAATFWFFIRFNTYIWIIVNFNIIHKFISRKIIVHFHLKYGINLYNL